MEHVSQCAVPCHGLWITSRTPYSPPHHCTPFTPSLYGHSLDIPQATNRPNVIVANLGYHGRTAGTMGMTTSGTIYRSGFFPQSSGVFVTPFPYMVNGPFGPAYSPPAPSHRAPSISKASYWGSSPAEVAATDTTRCEAIHLPSLLPSFHLFSASSPAYIDA